MNFVYKSKRINSLSSDGHMQRSVQVGRSGQETFKQVCSSMGLSCRKATDDEDINKHTDIFVNFDKGKASNKFVSYDVKGLKNGISKGEITVEWRNVNGKMGWCNDWGTPQNIAFQISQDRFLCVTNSELFAYTKSVCDFSRPADNFKNCFHRPYTRRGNKDLMSNFSIKEILDNCSTWEMALNARPVKKEYEKVELL